MGSLAAFICAVVGLWAVLYVGSQRVRYATKFTIYIIYVSFLATVLLPIAALRPCCVKNANLSTWAVSWLSPVFGLRFRIIGEEYLAADRAAVVICNHQSLVDFLSMCQLWPIAGKLAAVAKREILFIWPFGLIAWLSGTVFINRKQPGHSQAVVNGMEEKIKKEKIKLWVFAEGTRSDRGDLLPFKKGGFHLAKQGNLPIIPVVFSWYGTFLDHRAMRFDPGEITIKILPPVEFPPSSADGDDGDGDGDAAKEDMNRLVERVRGDMQAALESISPGLKSLKASAKGGEIKAESCCLSNGK